MEFGPHSRPGFLFPRRVPGRLCYLRFHPLQDDDGHEFRLVLGLAEHSPQSENSFLRARQSPRLNSRACPHRSFLVSVLEGVVLFEEGSELVEFLRDG